MHQIQKSIEESASKVQTSEALLESKTSHRDQELKYMREKIDDKSKLLNSAKVHLQDMEREVDRSDFAFTSAQSDFKQLEKKWGINVMCREALGKFSSPYLCPTCVQPITENTSHEDLRSDIKQSLNAA